MVNIQALYPEFTAEKMFTRYVQDKMKWGLFYHLVTHSQTSGRSFSLFQLLGLLPFLMIYEWHIENWQVTK